LSNELFYEIFDYLDGYHIYRAFSKLNQRFQQLLNSSSLLFKIHFHSTWNKTLINNYKQIIQLYSHKILSLNFELPLRSSIFIDSSFNHLKSLSLIEFDPIRHHLHISNLTSLPNLISLTIKTRDNVSELRDIYQFVFTLPKLKYIECSDGDSNEDPDPVYISLPMAINEQFSTIEHLVIDHECTFKELFAILSYTPQLRRFAVTGRCENPGFESRLPLKLLNLMSITFAVCNVKFDEFKKFIRSLGCKLTVLYFYNDCQDINYLDANQWKEFIMEYLPQLKKFKFEYNRFLHSENDCPIHPEDLNEFISSFWIQRKLYVQVEMYPCDVIYTIGPYK